MVFMRIWQVIFCSHLCPMCFRDLSWNQLRGAIPASQFASNITTMYKTEPLQPNHSILFIILNIWQNLSFIDHSDCIDSDSHIFILCSDLSHNYLNGSIPGIFSGLPKIQRLEAFTQFFLNSNSYNMLPYRGLSFYINLI